MEAVFLKILNMSLTASYVILTVLLIRLLLRKAPKKYSYTLWAVIGFRLCCPVSFQSALSLFSLKPFNVTTAQQATPAALTHVPGNVGTGATPQITTGTSAANAVINSSIPAAAPGNSVNPLQVLILAGTILWCLGMAAMVIYSTISYFGLRRRMSNAILLEGNVWQSDHIRSPFILGIFRPKIYIPFRLDEQTQRYVLAHEQYHLKQGDHVVKLAAFMLLSIHWFNPLCWLAFILMSRDMEMRCDEHVLSRAESSSKAYSMSLLSIAANRRFPSPSPLAFGETGVKSRIKNALSWKKPRLWVTITAGVLCVLVLLSCAANPKQETEENTLFGKTYVTQVTIFEDLTADITTLGTENQFRLDEDGTLFWYVNSQWMNQGKLENCQLSADNFDLCFPERSGGPSGWYEDLSSKQLREENKNAWLLLPSGESGLDVYYLYYLLLQQDGTIYLAWGHSDTLEDDLADSPIIRWVCRLEAVSTAPETTTPVTSGTVSSVSDSNTAQWWHCPARSAIMYAYFPITFDMEYTYIEAECSAGDLVDYDTKPTIIRGQQLTFDAGHSLYWSPYDSNGNEAMEATITFWVYNADTLIKSGSIMIAGQLQDDSSLDVCYTATLLDGSHLTLTQETCGGTITNSGEDAISSHEDPSTLITQALLKAHGSNIPDGNMGTVSYEVLQQLVACGAADADPDAPTGYSIYYLLATYQQFTPTNDGVGLTQHTFFPAIVTLDSYADGTHTLVEYWEPDLNSSAAYEADIRENFPQELQDTVLNPDRYLLRLTQKCYESAVQAWSLDTGTIIENLLSEITSSPAAASAPGLYIEAHQAAYDTLTYYGNYTLDYCFRQFLAGGGVGLDGHIMALACQDIMGAMGEAVLIDYATGPEWFNALRANALQLHQQQVNLEGYPGSLLLLNILWEE